ncbi:MAG: LamG domain-containing protein, partial [Pirellulaceae bacterium]|nr:LamG domain-containing protein [Pirellulaceae bacterium]
YSNSAGAITLRMNDAGEVSANSKSLTFATSGVGAWHHVVAVFDRTGTVGEANTVRLYVDNASEPVSTTLPDINGNPYNVVRALDKSADQRHGEQLFIGRARSTSGTTLSGYMDDIAFYRGVLSADDVNTLYTATSLNADTITTSGITPVMIQNFEASLDRSSETLGVVADDLGNYSGAMREFRQVTDETRGQVLEVNGLANINEYVSYGDVLDPMSDSYTVAAWFKLEDTGRNQNLMSKGTNTSSGAEGWAVIYNAGDGTLLVRGSDEETANKLAVRKALTVGDGKWHHVALVIDQDTGLFQAYLDGRGSGATGDANGWVPDLDDVSSLPQINFTPGTEFDSPQPLLLGHNGTSATSGDSNPMVGRIDDFAIWNRALSAAEISAMIPEPSSTALLLLALFSSLLVRRKSPK